MIMIGGNMEYGLVGEKLGHSYSKEIHEKLGTYEYKLCEVKPENLAKFILKKDYEGLNITIPYKEKVMQYLDYIDPNAKSVGAVNTIVNDHGILKGYNTDVMGLIDLINNMQISLLGKTVLILGTGGTSDTAYYVSKQLGASIITKVSRSKSNGKEIITYKEAYDRYGSLCDIIINTTPVGMYPNSDESPIDPGRFINLKGIIDVIYNPLKTKLVTQGKKLGISSNSGLYMLVSQAMYSSQLFLNKKYRYGTAKKIYNEIYTQKCNIVLTGMPGCGKTSVGKVLANKLDKTFIDVDDEIEKITSIKPGEYIEKYGEDEFRKIESETITKISNLTNCVIATGGGAVILSENIEKLKRNGRVYFIDRSVDKLVPTKDRPLSSSYEQIRLRYDERISKYKNTCDNIIPGDGTVDDTATKIIMMFKMR